MIRLFSVFLFLSGIFLNADKGETVDSPSKPWLVEKTATVPPSDSPPITQPEAVIRDFKGSYQKAGKPKVLIYVNRRLIRDRGELLATSEVNQSIKTKGDPVTTSSGGSIQIGSGNQVKESSGKVSGKGGERLETSSKSERVFDAGMQGMRTIGEMEVREIEESFQRLWMEAGVQFVDARVAQIANKSWGNTESSFLTSLQENKEKEEIESLKKSTDWVLEVMTEMRSIQILMPSGKDRVEERPRYVATLIRLKDGVKIAQVNSDTLFGFNRRLGEQKQRQMRQVTGSEIAEQTALALMQRAKDSL